MQRGEGASTQRANAARGPARAARDSRKYTGRGEVITNQAPQAPARPHRQRRSTKRKVSGDSGGAVPAEP